MAQVCTISVLSFCQLLHICLRLFIQHCAVEGILHMYQLCALKLQTDIVTFVVIFCYSNIKNLKITLGFEYVKSDHYYHTCTTFAANAFYTSFREGYRDCGGDPVCLLVVWWYWDNKSSSCCVFWFLGQHFNTASVSGLTAVQMNLFPLVFIPLVPEGRVFSWCKSVPLILESAIPEVPEPVLEPVLEEKQWRTG